MRRAIEGERPAGASLEFAAAVDCAAAARLRADVAGAALPRADIKSGGVAIGTIGRSMTGAGALFDAPSATVAGDAAARYPAGESLELVVGVTVASGVERLPADGDNGFFINL